MNITGTWKKITKSKCSEIYPEFIEFKSNNIFSAKNEKESTIHPVWDSGRYNLISSGKIKISTSYDALLTYYYEIRNGLLEFKDESDCIFQYKKVN